MYSLYVSNKQQEYLIRKAKGSRYPKIYLDNYYCSQNPNSGQRILLYVAPISLWKVLSVASSLYPAPHQNPTHSSSHFQYGSMIASQTNLLLLITTNVGQGRECRHTMTANRRWRFSREIKQADCGEKWKLWETCFIAALPQGWAGHVKCEQLKLTFCQEELEKRA